MACGSAGVRVQNISDPTQPHEVGYYKTPGYSISLTVRDSLIFVADGQFIGVYRYTPAVSANPTVELHPNHFSLSAHPNPFNPTTVLSFDIPRSGRVTISIYDITGRLVQTLADRVYPEGSFRINFDGSKLASGIYFARLQGNSFSKTQKLVLLK